MGVYDWEAEELRSWVLEEEHTPEEFARLTFERKKGILTVHLYLRIRQMREAVNRDDVSEALRAMHTVIKTYGEIEAMGPHDVFH